MDKSLVLDISLFIGTLILLGAGAFFFGSGLQGKVVFSQSCCFGDSCPQEQLCEQEPVKYDVQSGVGAGMMLLSFVGVFTFRRLRKNKTKS